ncbi:CynX/NimT family MFS transporter [Nitrincola sp. A-D6]|uniref:CynX/NimT family MFS transporter n=1 Tax=Nitrincola sp. A-D6 TaxID=1545442 RepID=UPI00068B06A5|nr:MFS transporter [Nitrincola sp. A-D6]
MKRVDKQSSPLERYTLTLTGLAVLGLLLAAANLRGGLVVFSPLVMEVREALSLSASAFGMLTTLPLICFAVISILVPLMTRFFSSITLVVFGLLIIALGVMLRLVASYPVVILGTLLLGSAIALLNVLIPVLVKVFFPGRVGLMTGLYSIMLSLGAGMGLYLAVPMMNHFNHWHYPVLVWALLPLVTSLIWLPLLKLRGDVKPVTGARVTLWKNPTAWAVTFYMGLQSFYFYAIVTWLPKILMESGLDPFQAGTATAMINLVSIPFNLFVPILAARMRQQQPLVVLIFLLSFSGLAGLWWAPQQAPMLWASLIGMGAGGSLSLALSFFILRTRDGVQATALSAMAQSLGYLLASSGPVTLALVHDLSGHWLSALLLLMLLQIFQLAFGWKAASAVQVKPDTNIHSTDRTV